MRADRDLAETEDGTRRRVVVGVTIVAGGVMTAGTLVAERGSGVFYAFGFGLAAVWFAGSVTSGPLRLVRPAAAGRELERPALVAGGVAVGVVAYGMFVAAAVVSRHLPLLGPAVDDLLGTADAGRVGLVLALALTNAVAEEVFFRGALVSAIGGAAAPYLATAAYAAVTASSGNVALVVAAVVMGTLFMAERVVTGGILASTVTHVTWSTLVLLALPR